uniref:Uncharacterized protein n=1 Tax=Arundo donax TaxID=35708 RepID=A0A0A9FR52_ARUDO
MLSAACRQPKNDSHMLRDEKMILIWRSTAHMYIMLLSLCGQSFSKKSTTFGPTKSGNSMKSFGSIRRNAADLRALYLSTQSFICK